MNLDELRTKLKPEQVQAAHRMLENSLSGKDKLTQEQLAAELGVTDRCLRKWRSENVYFNEYITQLSTNALRSHTDFVDAQLLEAVSKGHIKAMELYYKRSGLMQQVAVNEQLVDATARINEEELRERIEAMKASK